nr:hypothetical protein [Tanacetum cinerariifolium]
QRYSSIRLSKAGHSPRRNKGNFLCQSSEATLEGKPNISEIKTSEDVSEEDLQEMMQLIPVEEVYVEALQVKHPIIDWEIHTKGKKDYWKIIRLDGQTAVY